MCSIEKLGILGIRSFSPHTLETIKFNKPLTLIVGHNGAGKTTIVECLKMATTGEVPPTANKGQNFIHDPRLIGANEVKGQIRLIFSTPSGAQVATCRNFQLANTRDRRGLRTSFKALEAVVQLKDAQGNAKSTSNKCVDVNVSISGFMGVSKAVLENVIFCHQEDGNWPLCDMSTLKKKFDDLFGSSRFTKALEVINSIKKKYNKELKEKQHELNLIQASLSQMKSLEDKVSMCETKQGKLTNEIKQCSDLSAQAAKRLQQAEAELAEVGAFEQEWTTFNNMRREAEEKMNAYRSGMKEIYTETKDELLALKETFKVQAEEEERDRLSAERHVQTMEDKLERARRRQQQLQQESMDLVRAETAHKLAEEKLQDLLANVSKLRPDGKPSPSIEKLSSATQREAYVEELVAVMKETEMKRLESSREEKAKLQKDLQVKEKEVREMSDERSKLESEMNVLRVRREHSLTRQRQLEKVKAEEREAASEITKMRSIGTDDCDKAERAMEKLTNERVAIETELADIQTQLAKLETHREAQNEIKLKRQSRDECAERLRLVQAACLRLCDGFDNSAFINSLKSRCGNTPNNRWVVFVTREITRLREQFESLRSESQEAHRKHACAENTQAALKERSSSIEREIESLKNILEKAIGSARVEDFESGLSTAQEEFEETSREMLVVKNAEEMYNNYYQYSLKKKKCAFCTRHFQSDEEVRAFDSHMRSRIAKLPTQLSDAEKVAKQKKDALTVFEKLSTKVNKLGEKMMEAASLRSELATSEKEAIKAAEEASRVEVQFQEAEKELRCAEEMKSKLYNLNEIEGDLLVAEKAVEDIEASSAIPVEKDGGRLKSGKRSRASNARENLGGDWETELPRLQMLEKGRRERMNELLRDERQMMARVRESSERAERLRSLEQKRQTLGARLLELGDETGGETCADLEERLKSVETRLRRLEGDIQRHTETVSNLKKALETATQSELRAAKLHAQSQSHLSNLIDDLAQTIKAIEETASAVKKLSDGKTRIRDAAREETETAERYKEAKQKLHIQESKIRDRQALEQSLLENLNLLEYKDTVDQLTRRLNAKQAGSKVDVAGLKKSVSAAKAERQRCENEKSSKEGELKAVEDWKHSLAQELQHQKFRDLKVRHSDTEVEVCTMETLVNDLKRYHSALDRALMVYHTEKMKQINHSLKQLWREIYVGTDIDYLAIRSSTDADGTDEVVSGARSYNYRVVMVKGSVELEMRGRCSAGQKVLACLAIRLALAESFAVTCGIFTLDEPTTNLDRKNIESLAQALSQLIASRRSNSSFQLVLITHDEEFAEFLRRFGSTDVYYQVRKDGDGFSTIRAAKF